LNLLVFTPKITPRFRYVFRQIFVRILGIPVTFTASLDEFVAYSGPKFSYAPDQLGQEFHVYSHPLLWEQGIQGQDLAKGQWEDLPVIFSHNKPSQIPFDLFAASFYCLTRYEEHLPHLQDAFGRYDKSQSWVVAAGHLTLPLVDLWAMTFFKALQLAFPDLEQQLQSKKAQKIHLFDIVHPFKYRFKSIISKLIQAFKALWLLNLWDVLEQLLVTLKLIKDPYDAYDKLKSILGHPKDYRFFFSMAQKALDDSAVNTHSGPFQSLVKGVSDDYFTSLLVSYHAQMDSKELKVERNTLEQLTHRPVHTTRFHKGLIKMASTYPKLLAEEVTQDYSMGYTDQLGYRASTAVPFYFYDLQNEYQSPLLIYPVVACEGFLRTLSCETAFEQLEDMYAALPTPSAVFCQAWTPKIWQEDFQNETWRKQFLSYLGHNAGTV